MFTVGDLVLVKKRKGHMVLLATILHVSGDTLTVERSDRHIRNYRPKNVILVSSNNPHPRATLVEHSS